MTDFSVSYDCTANCVTDSFAVGSRIMVTTTTITDEELQSLRP